MTASAEPDPYAVLGVSRTATEHEIRAAYRALVARYHPDRHQDNPLKELASEKLAEINRAYALLTDPARRAAFDAGRSAASGARDHRAPGVGSPTSARGRTLILLLVLALPLLLRFGAPSLRFLGSLLRGAFEATARLRGTPLAAVAVLLALVVLGVAFLRRQRPKSRPRQKPQDTSPPRDQK